MKISVTYLVTILKYGYPPAPRDDFASLEYLSKLGFHYLEMEGLGVRHAAGLRNNLAEYKKALADNGIHVHNFCAVDPDLTSLDAGKRRKAYDFFMQMADVGCELGAETLHLASYAPPVEYVGRKPYQLDGQYEFGGRSRLRIPEDFSWRRVWDTVVESCGFCAEYGKKVGKLVIMEPRVDEVICSVDSMIRLLDDVGSDYLKANFDTGHFSAQRENVCLALEKLKGRYANIHIADNDPADTRHVPLGEGTIDWDEFFRVLARHGYDGYLGLDLGAKDDAQLEDWLIRSRDRVAELAGTHGLSVSW